MEYIIHEILGMILIGSLFKFIKKISKKRLIPMEISNNDNNSLETTHKDNFNIDQLYKNSEKVSFAKNFIITNIKELSIWRKGATEPEIRKADDTTPTSLLSLFDDDDTAIVLSNHVFFKCIRKCGMASSDIHTLEILTREKLQAMKDYCTVSELYINFYLFVSLLWNLYILPDEKFALAIYIIREYTNKLAFGKAESLAEKVKSREDIDKLINEISNCNKRDVYEKMNETNKYIKQGYNTFNEKIEIVLPNPAYGESLYNEVNVEIPPHFYELYSMGFSTLIKKIYQLDSVLTGKSDNVLGVFSYNDLLNHKLVHEVTDAEVANYLNNYIKSTHFRPEKEMTFCDWLVIAFIFYGLWCATENIVKFIWKMLKALINLFK